MRYCNRRKYGIILLVSICLLSCYGCQNQQEYTKPQDILFEKILAGMNNIISKAECADVEYKEVSYFENYSKIYYIEPEQWENYGLEDDVELASATGLECVEFDEGEQVVFLQTYNYQVCDYVEEMVYTVSMDNKVQAYVILIDREGTFIGVIREQEDPFYLLGDNKKEDLKEYVSQEIKSFGQKDLTETYVLGYCIGDINEDGYIDLYRPSYPVALYFGTDEGFKICSEKEAIYWSRMDYCSHEELEEQEKIKIFIDEYVSLEQIENKRVFYVQFHNVSWAECVNEQIRNLAQEYQDYYISMHIDDIVYISDSYLTVLMHTNTSDGCFPTGDVSYDGCRYVTFDLNTGEILTLENILGEDYTYEDVTELMWKVYEKKMNEVPDQYSKKLFDEYYQRVYKEYTEDIETARELDVGTIGNRTPLLEDYVRYYFTDDGMVVVYGRSARFSIGILPTNYYLNECLEVIEKEQYGKDIIEISYSWEEIYCETEE